MLVIVRSIFKLFPSRRLYIQLTVPSTFRAPCHKKSSVIQTDSSFQLEGLTRTRKLFFWLSMPVVVFTQKLKIDLQYRAKNSTYLVANCCRPSRRPFKAPLKIDLHVTLAAITMGAWVSIWTRTTYHPYTQARSIY